MPTGKTIESVFKKHLPTGLTGKMVFNEKLSRHSTFQIGGPADVFFELKQIENLVPLLQLCKKHKIPFFIFGGGSNILFSDRGFRGLVIKMKTKNMEVGEGFRVTADAGVAVASLIRFSIENNLAGLEPWIGLPGTVGGAIRGNAGCNGLETSEILQSATLLNPKNGRIRTLPNKYFQFRYRASKLKKNDEIVLSATFRLKKRRISRREQVEVMAKIRRFRITKQPFGASTGSFFKNPDQHKSAGFLIEQAGLKGKIIGKAQISRKHANFLLNLGGATAKDIIQLARLVRNSVKSKFGLKLKEEVQILSENGSVNL